MAIIEPTILALDFDGVICDGMSEYFATSWQTYCQIWKTNTKDRPDNLEERFAKYRPLIETGWEMPVLIRAFILDIPETEIASDWHRVCHNIAAADKLDPAELARQVDVYRDEWIERDLDSWLSLHKFYPGVVEQLNKLLDSSTKVIIITTKEGRFVVELLKMAGVAIERESIFGKEQKQPKSKTLKQLLDRHPQATIWFVEDRWQTLEKIAANPDLVEVKLYLADWGYNTESDRELATIDKRIKLINLTNFGSEFSDWHVDNK